MTAETLGASPELLPVEQVALLPCPFCGVDCGFVLGLDVPAMGEPFTVECPSCYAELTRDTAREALAAWNTRLTAAPAVDYNGHAPNRYVPDLPAGASLFAVNSATGAWHYVNHAGTWQGMPSPLAPAPVRELREAVSKAIDDLSNYGLHSDKIDRILAALALPDSGPSAGEAR